MEDTFQYIEDHPLRDSAHTITDMYFPFRDSNLEFTLKIWTNDVGGRWTSYCHELEGCITEGNSRYDCLVNLCYAIAECLVLNYDYLNIMPMSKSAKQPWITLSQFLPSFDYQPYTYSKSLVYDGNYSNFYLGKKHLLLKNPSNPKSTITLNLDGFKHLTKHLFDGIADINHGTRYL